MKIKFKKVISFVTLFILIFSLSVNTFEVTTYAATNPVTWNPTDKEWGVTLSNGNLTATISGLSSGVRASLGKSSGKWYWECTVDNRGYSEIGIANKSIAPSWVHNGECSGFSSWGYM
ncbi:hypothetical protein [Ruminiclostridium josui]|uniref:hypothetical protein n=1 Tax=Ruminiclostridium josui TaxID=1499 RepID=UPI0004639BCD|nr:hypothetical protein [Ruminiclostridium josui]